MTTQSNIEWTEQTWNPTTGCTKISPGCKHCYAETLAKRLQLMNVSGYDNGFKLSFMSSRLEQPLRRRKPTIYFVNSMSDLFHREVPFEYIDKIFDVISRTPQHSYQILTKRAKRMHDYFINRNVPFNAWLGVSVEDKEYGVPRIDYLRNVDANIRFLSVEPLLEDLGKINLEKIHWLIVGGESGPKARAMELRWVDNIQLQCEKSNVAFFFKQWGQWGADGKKRNKKANGRTYQGKIWNEMPRVSP